MENQDIRKESSIAGLDNSSPRKKRRWRGRKVWQRENKFSCIVKVACQPKCSDKKCPNCQFLKYARVRNLLKFCSFLDSKFPLWRWFNVYDNKQNGLQIASYTQTKRPISHNQ
jgi:hypothetical protein